MSNLQLNIYEEVLNDETICDYSSQNLETVPAIDNKLLCVLYLQNNKLKTLPEDFFVSLPTLMWLDLRNNLLTDIPTGIKNHPCLTHLLLQNNKLTSLPLELGTVVTLKVLQLSGNPLMFPPKNILDAGVSKIINYLHDQYVQHIFMKSTCEACDETASVCCEESQFNNSVVSYNSVIDEHKLKSNKLTVQLNEKESDSSDDEYYGKLRGKCPKLSKARHRPLPCHYQTCKYLRPLKADSSSEQTDRIKRNYLKELAIKKHKDLMIARDKILQDRKNIELLKNWRVNYRKLQCTADSSYKMGAKHFPYDTNPEYMTLLTREDIERDLPDKYRKKLTRRCKPTSPRKSNNDVHLALKIKQLFQNLEAIDLNREGLTPRTEQKVLLNEIQKITEIKQKLTELSNNNVHSIVTD